MEIHPFTVFLTSPTFKYTKTVASKKPPAFPVASPLPGGFLAPPPVAQRWERQGLSCDVRLPQGARPMAPPPVVGLGAVVDPREEPELRTWAQEVGQGGRVQCADAYSCFLSIMNI